MTDAATGLRFYGELARWWTLISPPGEYVEEAGYVASLLRSTPEPTLTVLEMGSGGGNNAVHLASEFEFTLTDLSDEMLDVSRVLNPGVEHLQGDMRSLRLGRTFDAVFVHDAIDYMITEDDLRAALTTAFVHCRPGGAAILMPDSTVSIFEPDTDSGGSDAPDGSSARYTESTRDPDPTDTWVETEYAFTLREADGSVRFAHETHRTGLFDRQTWLRLLGEVGFDAHLSHEVTTEDRTPRDVFLGHRQR